MVSVLDAQGADAFLIEMWDVERGLPNSTVTGIVQAPEGYLWLGTFNGLARFDGVRFQTFAGPWSHGLRLSGYNELAVNGLGEIWALAENGELVTGDGTGFQPLGNNYSNGTVRALWTDSARGVWANLTNGGVARLLHGRMEEIAESREYQGIAAPPVAFPDGTVWWLSGSGTWLEFEAGKLQVRRPQGDADQAVVGLGADSNGSAWVLGEHSFWQCRKPDWIPIALPAGAGVPFRGLAVGCQREVWVWNDQGIWRLKDGNWLAARGAWPLGFVDIRSSVPLPDSEGRLWFGTRGQGLLVVNAMGQITQLTVKDGLPSNFIRGLTLDHEGSVWAATHRGLVRLKSKLLRTPSWDDPEGEAMATGLAEASNGDLWIGTYGDGVRRLPATESDLEPGRAQRAFNLPKSCRAMVFDHGQQLWVGSVREGLWKLSAGQLTQAVLAGLPDGEARTLLCDTRNRLWIGTTKGLFRLEQGSLSPQPGPPEMSALDVRCLLEDTAGNLWVGTHNQGLLRWNADGWTRVPPTPPAALLSIWSLHQDRHGDLWIGTQGSGLANWSGGRLAYFNRTNGLAADTICAILEDDEENLWLASYQGIFRISKEECAAVASGRRARLSPRTFTHSDGMPTLQCTGSFQPTARRMQDGRLVFPTIQGLVVVDPKRSAPAGPAPQVVIEEVVFQGQSARPESGLRLGPRPGRLEFHYTALSFAAPERVRFRYRLDGEDRDWLDAGGERMVAFNALPPGDYSFRVTACNADGVWNEAGATLAFVVVPAWWQWRWLQCAGLLSLTALVAGMWRRLATRRLRVRLESAKRQGAVDRERARIAQDIHDELGTSLTRIIMLSQAGDAQSGPASPELLRIHETARNLTRAMDEVVWAVNPRQDTLEGLGSYASIFVQEFLNEARLICRLDLPSHVPPWPLSAETRHNVFLALKEAVHNIVQHARAREVRLTLRLAKPGFVIEIADDGVGFELDPANPPGPAPGGRRPGQGLHNMRSRLEAIGGNCEIRSAPGQGATVIFTVPILPPHVV